MDKYDHAIEFLKAVEPGSYFDECAALMEELVARDEPNKPKPARFSAEEQAWMKRSSGGARHYAKARGLL